MFSSFARYPKQYPEPDKLMKVNFLKGIGSFEKEEVVIKVSFLLPGMQVHPQTDKQDQLFLQVFAFQF